MTDKLQEMAMNIYKLGYADGCQYGMEISKDYEQGLDDAWECARKITFCKQGRLCEIFPEKDYDNDDFGWLNDYSASEAIAKVKEYEEQRISDNGLCSILDNVCPYVIRCKECHVFCAVKKARKDMEQMKGAKE